MEKIKLDTKIALINPPYREMKHIVGPIFPIGLGYIKATMEKIYSIKCDLFDFSVTNKSNEELIKEYKLEKYSIIGISTFSLNFLNIVDFIKSLKNLGIIIIVGGHHASLTKEKLLIDFDFIDFSIIGFGEHTFSILVNHLINNNLTSLCNIDGICYRKDDGSIVYNPPSYKNFDIKNIPFPDRNDIIYDYKLDIIDSRDKVLTISSSRGCPYLCTYCVNCNNNDLFIREVEDVLNEIKYLLNKNDYNHIEFIDCNFFLFPKRALSIIENIKRNFSDIGINFQTRTDQIVKNKKYIEKIANYSNISINLGVESNSETVLKRYNKQTTPNINQEAINILKALSIEVTPYIIMFESLESINDIRKNFDFIIENNLTKYNVVNNLYQTLMPFYGTEYYLKYKNYYTGSIHKRMIPIFLDNKVKSLYDVLYKYRNEFEDVINEIIYNIHKKIDKNNDYNYIDELLNDANLIMKLPYSIFEYFLIMIEKYDTCDYNLFLNSNFVNIINTLRKKYND